MEKTISIENLNVESDVIFNYRKKFELIAPISVNFEPKPDITAFELAQLLPYFSGNKFIYESDWESLGSITRHLVRQK